MKKRILSTLLVFTLLMGVAVPVQAYTRAELIIKDNLQYDRVYDFSEGFARVGNDTNGRGLDKWGLIDSQGNEVVPPKYDYLSDVSDGMVKVGMNLDGDSQTGDSQEANGIDKYGFIDTKGNEIVPLIYDHAYEFSEGLAAVATAYQYLADSNSIWKGTIWEGTVMTGLKYGFVDKTGKEVIPIIYDSVSGITEWDGDYGTKKRGFFEGVVFVSKNGKTGAIDKKGNTVIPFIYNGASGFKEGLAAVSKNDKWGFIDKQGKVIAPLTYDLFEDFSEGFAVVGKHDRNSSRGWKYGVINKQGKLVVPVSYDLISSFSDGMARVGKTSDATHYKYGFIDTTGKLVIPMTYDYVSNFSEGLAKVGMRDERFSISFQNKEGFIDKQGNIIVPMIYDYVGDFSEGLAFVGLNAGGLNIQFSEPEQYGYIDTSGNMVIPMAVSKYASDSSGGVAVRTNQNWTYAVIKNPLYTETKPVGGAELVVNNQLKASSQSRLAGNDRYQTAVAISKSGWTKSDNVLLVCGDNFPDALVGSSFAYALDAPILLTPPNSLNSDTKTEIERLGAKNIYILGNTESVSQSVQNSLSGYNVVRISGAGVFDTAVKVGEKLRETVKFDMVAIGTQENFPDSLAIAPFSAKYAMPILFSEKDKLRADTKKSLQDWGIKKVIITGGTGVISGAVESELKAMGITVTRLAGNDRYDTCLEITKYFEVQSGGYSQISIATGNNYPDSLSGAVLAAKNNTPLILVNKDTAKSNVAQYINAKSIGNAFIFGGTSVVSDNVVGK